MGTPDLGADPATITPEMSMTAPAAEATATYIDNTFRGYATLG